MHISVIGAGPSGCIAAASAVEEGYNPTIFEEHKKIGYPEQCGGLLSKKAVDWFQDLGVDCKKTIQNQIKGIEIHCQNKIISIDDKKTKAFVVQRSEFDQSCFNFAEDNGAKFITGKKLSQGAIRQLAKNSFIVGADGPFSTVAETFNFPEIRDYAVAYQSDVVNLSLNKAEKTKVQVYLYEKSFGWVIPMNEERAHAGLIFFTNPDFRKFNWFLDTIKSDFNKKKLKTEHFFTDCIPFSIRPKIQKKNVYLVGDAAGQVKATSGGGIYYGCQSAWLAGKTIKTKNYSQKWKQEIGKELENHAFVRKVINSMNPNIICSFIDFVSIFGLKNILSRYNMENISSLVKI